MCPLIDTEATFSDRQSQLQKQKQNKKTKTFLKIENKQQSYKVVRKSFLSL